jgi:hypothetical protein
MVAQALADFRLSSPIADLARLSLKFPCDGIDTPGSLAEVASTHDIVPLAHAPGLVSCHLHRDRRGSRADEIADGRSSEVVQDSAGTPGCRTGRPEPDAEARDRPARAPDR